MKITIGGAERILASIAYMLSCGEEFGLDILEQNNDMILVRKGENSPEIELIYNDRHIVIRNIQEESTGCGYLWESYIESEDKGLGRLIKTFM